MITDTTLRIALMISKIKWMLSAPAIQDNRQLPYIMLLFARIKTSFFLNFSNIPDIHFDGG